MASKTGEKQEMTEMTTSEEDKERLKQYFKAKQKDFTEQKAIADDRFKNAKEGSSPTYKGYIAFISAMWAELSEVHEHLENIYENLIEMEKGIVERDEKLEKQIQEVANNTGTELTNLKSTLKEPMWTRIDEFLQNVKEEAKKRKNVYAYDE